MKINAYVFDPKPCKFEAAKITGYNYGNYFKSLNFENFMGIAQLLLHVVETQKVEISSGSTLYGQA